MDFNQKLSKLFEAVAPKGTVAASATAVALSLESIRPPEEMAKLELLECMTDRELSNNEVISRIDSLIEDGADVNAADKEGFTPLVYAIGGGRLGVVQHLLDKQAKINQPDEDGITPLMYGVQVGPDTVDLLLKAGADPGLRAANGRCAADLTPDHAIRLKLKDAQDAIVLAKQKAFDAMIEAALDVSSPVTAMKPLRLIIQ